MIVHKARVALEAVRPRPILPSLAMVSWKWQKMQRTDTKSVESSIRSDLDVVLHC
jgi:hypothetical protein